MKTWLNAPNSCDAPLNDLVLLQTLESYDDVDRQLAEVAIKKMTGQLWFLSEDLAGLALFCDQVVKCEKVVMIDALKKPSTKPDYRRLEPKSIDIFQSKTLSDFGTEKSLNLFTAFKINHACLSGSPSTWSTCPEYVNAKQMITGLKVINNCAKRAAKLATDFK